MKNKIKLINTNNLKKYLLLAKKSKNKRYRISLHNSKKDLIQESIIFANGFSYIAPHKHPKNKTESYHIIRGQLNIYLLNNKGQIIKKIILKNSKKKSKKFFQIYKLLESVYHLIIPRSKYTIWHEVTSGPFIKDSKKFMKIAKFSPSPNSKISFAKDYCNQLCKMNVDKLV